MRTILEKIKKASPARRRLYYFLFTGFCLVLITISILSFYVGRVYYIKNFGINLVPRENHPVQSFNYYRQNDPEWQNTKIGNSERKMGSTGCLISCVSTAISELSYPIKPNEFNDKLTQMNGFQEADLIWYKINEAYPNIDYRYSRIFNNKMIEADLKKGLLPIVNVKYHKTGVTHWVLIVGAEEGEFIICDPLGDGQSTKLLSEHGRVYAYRVIEKVNH